jgi:hypothetical protein
VKLTRRLRDEGKTLLENRDFRLYLLLLLRLVGKGDCRELVAVSGHQVRPPYSSQTAASAIGPSTRVGMATRSFDL